jgi:outer membrane receptor protein involved in Fe transport
LKPVAHFPARLATSALRLTAGALAGAALALAASPAAAQDAEAARLSLDSLLAVPVHAASRYAQAMSDAPAAVTVVTGDEIAAHGYRTLAELLAGVAGFYVSYDRNYTYVGVRGFSRPGDYNNRLLVMLNGRPLNDGIYGAVLVGTDLGVDLSVIDRVEIVRGPVSALYGTSAMLAAVNLVTRKREGSSARMRVETGLDGLLGAAAQVGGRLGPGASGFLSAYGGRVDGADVYVREYDDGTPGSGVAHGRDWDRYAGVLATADIGGLSVQGRISTRTKGVPTGAWETIFDDGRFQTTDQWLLLAMEYTRAVRPNLQLSASAGFDEYRYRGSYPGDEGLFEDANLWRRVTAETRALWDPSPRLRVTAGAAVADNPRVEYRRWMDGEALPLISRPFRTASVYLQNELQVAPWLSLTGGARVDDETFTPARITPRLAAVVRASPGTVFKALYGQAFRSPAMYEVTTGSGGFKVNSALQAEHINTYELVVEQRVRSASLRVSLFNERFAGLIDPVLDPVDSLYAYVNRGSAHAHGVEAELTASHGGWLMRGGGAAVVAHDHDNAGRELTNSPAYTGRLALTGPLARAVSIGARVRAETGRLTLAGARTAPFAVVDLNLVARLNPRLRASLLTQNLLDAAYAYPGGIEHRQDMIPQDGRKLGLRLEYVW